ncbi:splicing factor 3B subunit 2 [Chrysoperla carnea]|uniref:splicing factor 3B subunit 2 n=1 Tax=Chrysoperla carnea TaxID=189513 RepID=UPI001D062805|nr:splicing factor 3B subunit 2 [Chrysoperla carnea]
MDEGKNEINNRIQQQKMMIEQQRQDELLRLQQSALHEMQQESLNEHESEMQRQMLSVPAMGQNGPPPPPPPAPTGIPSLLSTNFLPPPTAMPPPQVMGGPPPPGGKQPGPPPNWNPNMRPPGTGSDDMMAPPGVEDGVNKEKALPSLLTMRVERPSQLGENPNEVVVLPQALEQALAFKDQRAQELGVNPEEVTIVQETIPEQKSPTPVISYGLEGDADSDEGDDETSNKTKDKSVSRPSKNKRKKKRKKARKAQKQQEKVTEDKTTEKVNGKESETTDVEVEYIQETLGLHELAPMYRQFHRIFEAFKISDEKDLLASTLTPASSNRVPAIPADDDQFQQEEGDDDKKVDAGEKAKLSKRKLKKLTRLSVAELKQLVSRPDVVEMHDVTARDPKLLVQLKAHRNTVQVPRHWCFKRKYLQGKRGIEKPPFNLPEFIKKTGIMEMRASLQDKDESKTLKAKMRERVRPKLGKIDIDYQKLHDAFFKWQTKPKMTIHGDLYYEGKEYETRLKEKKPGDLSEELRTALGMPVGPSSNKVPPPWLIAMQRYGPPPSYPNLKIPGLNAPIPENCSFGYHAGGWGKPPVDENGKPLYGDVFGSQLANVDDGPDDTDIDRTLWGELESESEESSAEESEEEEGVGAEGQDAEAVAAGLATPAEGLATPSGLSSVPAGMETPDTIELRKKKIESEMEGGETPVLYQVLPERRNERLGTAMMASTHVYDMTGAGGAPPPAVLAARRLGQTTAPVDRGTVELALDPSELDLDTEAMAVRYEQQMREQQSQLQKEDLSDMLAEHVARQKSKRKRQQNVDTKQSKKYKEFKF